MAVPQQLLQELLLLDEPIRREIAHALLDSVEPDDDVGITDAERSKLDTVITRSVEELDSGKGIPLERALAEIRAKRATRDRPTR